MTNDPTNPLTIVEESNTKMLDYFNKIYVSNLEQIQLLKTELFEIKIQIETLEKTKELYTYHTDNRRNIFSPISEEPNTNITKGKKIALEIQDLTEKQTATEKYIAELEENTLFYKEQVEMLSKANKCIQTLIIETKLLENDDPIEFIETDDSKSKAAHGYHIMMLEDYDRLHSATLLDQNVRQPLISHHDKLESVKWMLHSDIGRAKVTLDELLTASEHILSSADSVLEELDYNTEQAESISEEIQQLLNHYRKQHPEYIIDDICTFEENMDTLPPAVNLRFLRMLKEIFHNIFNHSNANTITARITMNPRFVDVSVSDNGIGISEDYLQHSSWHSGLHRLHETIYQLDGNLQIEGDVSFGTVVRFSFPLKE